jgi:hypothetical protein
MRARRAGSRGLRGGSPSAGLDRDGIGCRGRPGRGQALGQVLPQLAAHLKLAAHGVGMLREALQELRQVRRLAVLLAQEVLTEDQGQHQLEVGLQGGKASEVVLDARPLAALPALALVLHQEHGQADGRAA